MGETNPFEGLTKRVKEQASEEGGRDAGGGTPEVGEAPAKPSADVASPSVVRRVKSR